MTVRTDAVSAQVKPLEISIINGDYKIMSDRESLAVQLAERIASDPHTVDDVFWDLLKTEFDDDELVELVFACSTFNWGNKFNITMRLDTDGVCYPAGMEYANADA